MPKGAGDEGACFHAPLPASTPLHVPGIYNPFQERKTHSTSKEAGSHSRSKSALEG